VRDARRRILGLDLGSRRIGLAVSDEEARIAFPEGTLERRTLEADLTALRRLVEERGVGRIVVGLPKHLSGRVGPEAQAAQAFAARLAEETGLPVETLDERWTTLEAERALRASGRRGARRRAVIDAVAASLILDTYLARRRRLEEEGGSAR